MPVLFPKLVQGKISAVGLCSIVYAKDLRMRASQRILPGRRFSSKCNGSNLSRDRSASIVNPNSQELSDSINLLIDM